MAQAVEFFKILLRAIFGGLCHIDVALARLANCDDEPGEEQDPGNYRPNQVVSPSRFYPKREVVHPCQNKHTRCQELDNPSEYSGRSCFAREWDDKHPEGCQYHQPEKNICQGNS